MHIIAILLITIGGGLIGTAMSQPIHDDAIRHLLAASFFLITGIIMELSVSSATFRYFIEDLIRELRS